MADRYWVGTGTWNATNTANWSTTSGGSGGASAPNNDTVYFDANSTGVCTVATGARCGNAYTTNHAGSFAGSGVVYVTGFVSLGKDGFPSVEMRGSFVGGIYSNGYSFGVAGTSNLGCVTVYGNCPLTGDLNFANSDSYLSVLDGTFNANGYNVNCRAFLSEGTLSRTVNMGSGTWTIGTQTSGYYAFSLDGSNLTFTKSTANIVIQSQSGAGRKVRTGGREINNLTVTMAANRDFEISNDLICNDLSITYDAGTLTGQLKMLGNVTVKGALSSTRVNADSGTTVLKFTSTSGTKAVTWPSFSTAFNHPVEFDGAGGNWRFDGPLIQAAGRAVTLTRGTVDLNYQNNTFGSFVSSNSNTRALTMWTGTLSLASSGTVWDITTSTGLTITPSTSVIKLVGTAAQTFAGSSKTYANLWAATTGGNAIITGSNTWADVKADPGVTIAFAAGSTQTVSSFTMNGISGSSIGLISATPGSAWNLSKASGTVQADWTNITDSHAAGGATFKANGVDGGGNSGWTFGIRGFLTLTQANAVVSAAAKIAEPAVFAMVEQDDTVSASGLLLAPGSGIFLLVEANDTSSGAATLKLVADADITAGNETLSGTSGLLIKANSAMTEAPDRVSAGVFGIIYAVGQVLSGPATLLSLSTILTPPDYFTRVLMDRDSAEVIIILVTISHPSLEKPVRLALNTPGHDITSNGEIFTATYFDVTLMSDNDQTPKAKIRAPNVNREVGALIDSLDGPPTVRFDVVLASNPDRIEKTFKQMKVRGVSWDASMIEADLGQKDFTNTPWPVIAATPALFPALFK